MISFSRLPDLHFLSSPLSLISTLSLSRTFSSLSHVASQVALAAGLTTSDWRRVSLLIEAGPGPGAEISVKVAVNLDDPRQADAAQQALTEESIVLRLQVRMRLSWVEMRLSLL